MKLKNLRLIFCIGFLSLLMGCDDPNSEDQKVPTPTTPTTPTTNTPSTKPHNYEIVPFAWGISKKGSTNIEYKESLKNEIVMPIPKSQITSLNIEKVFYIFSVKDKDGNFIKFDELSHTGNGEAYKNSSIQIKGILQQGDLSSDITLGSFTDTTKIIVQVVLPTTLPPIDKKNIVKIIITDIKNNTDSSKIVTFNYQASS